MAEKAIVFYTLLEQANLMTIEKNLAGLSPEDRAEQESLLEDLGYNMDKKPNDKNERLKRIFNG